METRFERIIFKILGEDLKTVLVRIAITSVVLTSIFSLMPHLFFIKPFEQSDGISKIIGLTIIDGFTMSAFIIFIIYITITMILLTIEHKRNERTLRKHNIL